MLKTCFYILLAFVLIYRGETLAQEKPKSMGLVVSPAIIDVSLDRGKVSSLYVVVKNTSTEATGFVVSLEGLALGDFASLHDVELIPPEWIKAEQQEFILNPGEVKKIGIVFYPSNDTPPGGYYGTMYIQPVSDLTLFTDEKTASVPKVGVLLLTKIKGKSIQNVVFTGFKIGRVTNNKESIILGFENLGNVHTMPSGNVVVTNLMTKRKLSFPLTPTIIFPNTSKEIDLDTKGKLSAGLYSLAYSDSTKSKSTVSLIIDPTTLLITCVLTIALILLKIYMMNYFMSKRHPRKFQ